MMSRRWTCAVRTNSWTTSGIQWNVQRHGQGSGLFGLGFVLSNRVLAMLEAYPHLMRAAVRLPGQEVARMRSLVCSTSGSGLRHVD